jgi:DNA modification methylase
MKLNCTIINSDCLTALREMPDKSVHCCVTSPPYFGLRQYLFDGAYQIRHDLPDEKKFEIEAELAKRGITPKS